MNTREKEEATKKAHDKMQADQRDAMVKGGMPYEKAARESEKVMSEAAELADRRRREK